MGDRHVPSRVLSNGPDIRPDLNISPDEYVKEEAFQKWMKANDTVLRARTRQSFIAGAICGIFVLVSIIMAGVSLGKIAENGGKIAENGGKIAVNGGKIAENGGKIAVNEGKIAVNEGKIAVNGGKIAVNEGKIAVNEGKIAENGS